MAVGPQLKKLNEKLWCDHDDDDNDNRDNAPKSHTLEKKLK